MLSRKKLFVAAGASILMATAFHAAAQPTDAPVRKSEPILGYRLMNDQERDEYREKMRNARNVEERQALRDEHRKTMEARAKERGVTLPEPRRGIGAYGRGPRGGVGPGGNSGPGSGAGGRQGKGSGAGPRPDCPGATDCPGPGAGRRPGSL